MHANKFCVFQCVNVSDKIWLFTDEKLRQCHEKLCVRKALHMKYSDVVLPDHVTETHGYHSICCKNFMAISKKYLEKYGKLKQSEEDNIAPVSIASDSAPSTSSTSNVGEETSLADEQKSSGEKESTDEARNVEHPTDTSSLFPMSVEEQEASDEQEHVNRVCFFCKKARKVANYRVVPIYQSTDDQKLRNEILMNAVGLNDVEMENRVKSLGIADLIAYHNPCKTLYFKKYLKAPKTIRTDWHITRNLHEAAYAEVCKYVEQFIIEKKKSQLFQYLTEIYNEILDKSHNEEFGVNSAKYTSQQLLEKLQHTYADRIQVIVLHKKKIIAPRDGCVIDDETFSRLEEDEFMARAALALRKQILRLVKKPLPHKLKISDLIAGECEIPLPLHDFMKILLCGVDSRTQNSNDRVRKIKSISQDIVYTIFNGKVKTAKHITLGMTLKSITSSRKVVDLINKFGHCCSYNVIEELETEATFSTSNNVNISPEDAVLQPNLCTGVAFDNYDRFVETCTGKDTLHDTVGIFYQNICTDDICTLRENNDDVSTQPAQKKRRTFDAIVPELRSYSKKPSFRENLLPVDSELRVISSGRYNFFKKLDLAWVFSHYCKIPDTPMWVGFNHKITEDNSIKQKISYLTPINLSPTDKSVVYETMRQAQQIGIECEQNYMQVTYDLAIAKVAFAIQSMEKPDFKNIFINMGAFHVMMSYFKAVGKFINECGLTQIMVESNLLANGSVNGFISGKHFNRCKRLHPLVSLGLQVLHVEQFLKSNEIEITNDIVEYLTEFQSRKVSDDDFYNREFSDILIQYSDYKQKTLTGVHGKTAQFYAMYIEFVNYYTMFTRSIRVGDFDLYKLIMPKLCNLFFVFNQNNYSRWLLAYLDKLLMIEENHPELAAEFKKGMFGIKRTNHNFSRLPIDLTLEQTINADAARRLTGVTHFTNSISARQRWSKSHSIRSTIISHVYNESGIKRFQDTTAALEKHTITNDTKSLASFIAAVKQNINPFDCLETKGNFLFNIKTGRRASDSVTDFLLNVEENGQAMQDSFISECSEDVNRFEAPIKQNKILNFSSCNSKKKITVNNKVREVRMQRDLFGRMLGISMKEAADIEKMLSYPITPIPTSLCHLDGTICKTEKSALLKNFRNDSTLPPATDVVIVDGFFLLHCIKNVPNTFGNISKKILQILCSYDAPYVHIVFDRYCRPSIKDYERSLRGGFEADYEYVISGPEQTKPNDFSKELRNNKFKEALIEFLISHWQTSEVGSIIGNKRILLNYIDCYLYEFVDNNVIRTTSAEFCCSPHEEADTKIIYHAFKIESNSNIVVKCSDTDIVVILLGNLHKIKSKIWIECGISDKCHVINVNELHESLGLEFCKALPGFHALTGCDYNPSFFRKGKQRPYKTLLKSIAYQIAFADLGNIALNKEETFSKIESFVCDMYGLKSCDKVNQLRFELFHRNYTIKNVNEPFQRKQLKNFDASCLPPCYVELRQQLERTHYIANVWKNSTLFDPYELEPENCGWILNGSEYEFKWFEGPQLPPSVKDVVIDSESSEAEDDDDIYDSDADIESDDDMETEGYLTE